MIKQFHTFNRLVQAGLFAGTILLLATPTPCAAADTLIAPNNPAINYYGRFDFSNPKAPRFNWSGSVIEFKVTGTTTAGMELTDGAGYYDIEIDGKLQPASVNANSYSSKKYVFTTALSPDAHVIRIVKRNEPYWVITTFGGIYLTGGATLVPTAKPTRKMEFCGDSYTAGYFIEGCADQQAQTNTNKSWARLVSRAFRAQDIIMAESGIGLTKSLGGKTNFPRKYLGTFDTVGGAATPMWNFSSWTPDMVTVFLGINDKSSGATDAEYTTAVHSFVTTIRGNYPSAPILFIAATGCMDGATRAAVAAETTSLGHKNTHFIECKQQVKGCSWHPDIADAKEIADSVIVKIRQITGWDTTAVPVTTTHRANRAHPDDRITLARIDSRTLHFSTRPKAVGSALRVVDATGRIAELLPLDCAGTCTWNTESVSNGAYFIGSIATGWARIVISK